MATKQNNTSDLQDSKKDQEKMKPETVVVNLPEVKDIPGQESFEPLPLGELADSTAASDDEEGVGLLDDLNAGDNKDEDPLTDNRTNVSLEEKRDLHNSANITPGEEDADNLHRATLDTRDEEGDLLEERSGRMSGDDLDVPGSEDDDVNEESGAEDEENNPYSLGGDRNEQ